MEMNSDCDGNEMTLNSIFCDWVVGHDIYPREWNLASLSCCATGRSNLPLPKSFVYYKNVKLTEFWLNMQYIFIAQKIHNYA